MSPTFWGDCTELTGATPLSLTNKLDLANALDAAVIVRAQHDLRGNLIADEDALGRPRRFAYDESNRLTSVYINVATGTEPDNWRALARFRYDPLPPRPPDRGDLRRSPRREGGHARQRLRRVLRVR